MNNENLQSQTINYLRFPLIILVIFIHSYGTVTIQSNSIEVMSNQSVFNNVSYLLSMVFARLAVPLFFLISGFLYFYKC